MKLTFLKRSVAGKKVAALRRDGQTPVACYSKGEKPVLYSVDTQSLLKSLVSGSVVIETDGDMSGKQVILQDISFHPVSDMPLHADFLFVDATHEVEHEVAVQVIGEAPGVKIDEGQMVVVLDKVSIRALPQNIPAQLDADVSVLKTIGSRLLVSDLLLPNGVTLVTSPDEIVVSILEKSQADEEEINESYMEDIEVTGKGGKKADDELSEEEVAVS